MIDALGWILLGLLLLWHIYRNNWMTRRRMHLVNYVVMLMFIDEYRDDHRTKLENWLGAVTAKDASELYSKANVAIDLMAEDLAKGDPDEPLTASIVGAQAILWHLKTGEE